MITQLWDYTKTTELYILTGWIVLYVDYSSIKLLKKKIKTIQELGTPVEMDFNPNFFSLYIRWIQNNGSWQETPQWLSC